MTHAPAACAERLAFLAAIAEEHAEDTPRLAFADWLEEYGDARDVARAELIRVQCEADRIERSGTHWWYRDESYDKVENPEYTALLIRESALIREHEAHWRAGPTCEACGGKGTLQREPDDTMPLWDCPNCCRSGDAGGLMRRGHSDWRHPVHFERGFIARVTVPTLADLVVEERDFCSHCMAGTQTLFRGPGATNPYTRDCPHCAGNGSKVRTLPSALLRGIVGAVAGSPPERGLVAEVVALDREPHHYRAPAFPPDHVLHGLYRWGRRSSWGDDEHTDLIPDPVFELLEVADVGHSSHSCRYYRTRELAVTALARALAQFGRMP